MSRLRQALGFEYAKSAASVSQEIWGTRQGEALVSVHAGLLRAAELELDEVRTQKR